MLDLYLFVFFWMGIGFWKFGVIVVVVLLYLRLVSVEFFLEDIREVFVYVFCI